MTIAQSRITAQGQISVPAQVRKQLGVGPGSLLEFEEKGGEIVLRRAERHTFAEVHAALFGVGVPKSRSLREMKDGIRARMLKRHARD